MRAISRVLHAITFACFFALLAGPASAAYDWSSFTSPPRTVPFTENNVTYTAFVQTRHPWYSYNQIVYYPAGISTSLKPVGVDYNQGPQYQHLWLLLNPTSQSQAYDSTNYNPNVIVYTCVGDAVCRNNTWGDPASSNQIRNQPYTWFDWNGSGPTGYDIRSDLVRAVGIDIKVNFSYNWNGQFGLGYLAASDVLVTGQPVFSMKLPLPGNKTWRLTVQTGGADCWSTTDPYHTDTVNGYYSLDFDDISYQNGQAIQETNVPIYAAASGTVDTGDYGYDANGYGYWVRVNHGNGYKTLYAHMTAQSLITNGAVSQGAQLGYVGTTPGYPYSTGTHLHFQVTYNGNSLSTTTELDLIRMEGKKLTEYLVGSSCSAVSGYYPSTNTK